MIQTQSAATAQATAGFSQADMLVETMASKRYLTQRRALLDIATQALEHMRDLDASEVERLHELKALRATG